MRLSALMLAGGCLVVEEVRVVAREAPRFLGAGSPREGLSVSLAAESGGSFYFKLWNVSGRPLLVSTDPRLFGPDRLEIRRLRKGASGETLRKPASPVEADPRCAYFLSPGAVLVRPVRLDLALPRGEYGLTWIYWVTGEDVWTGLARSNVVSLRVHGRR